MGCIQSANNNNNNNRLTRRSVHNKLQNVLTSNAIRTPKNNPQQHASLIYDKENNASAYIVSAYVNDFNKIEKLEDDCTILNLNRENDDTLDSALRLKKKLAEEIKKATGYVKSFSTPSYETVFTDTEYKDKNNGYHFQKNMYKKFIKLANDKKQTLENLVNNDNVIKENVHADFIKWANATIEYIQSHIYIVEKIHQTNGKFNLSLSNIYKNTIEKHQLLLDKHARKEFLPGKQVITQLKLILEKAKRVYVALFCQCYYRRWAGRKKYEDRKAEVVNQLYIIDNIRFLGSRLQFVGKQLKIVEIAKFIELKYLQRQNLPLGDSFGELVLPAGIRESFLEQILVGNFRKEVLGGKEGLNNDYDHLHLLWKPKDTSFGDIVDWRRSSVKRLLYHTKKIFYKRILCIFQKEIIDAIAYEKNRCNGEEKLYLSKLNEIKNNVSSKIKKSHDALERVTKHFAAVVIQNSIVGRQRFALKKARYNYDLMYKPIGRSALNKALSNDKIGRLRMVSGFINLQTKKKKKLVLEAAPKHVRLARSLPPLDDGFVPYNGNLKEAIEAKDSNAIGSIINSSVPLYEGKFAAAAAANILDLNYSHGGWLFGVGSKRDTARNKPALPVSKELNETANLKNFPSRIPYKYLEEFTENFGSERKAAESRFGFIYNGVDPATGVRFTVKRLEKLPHKQSFELFMKEIEELAKFGAHRNIVKILGFSPRRSRYYIKSKGKHEESTMQHDCLILEDCASNTLDKMLKDDTEANLLTWRVRVRIAIDIATALTFMHRGGGGFGDARCLHGDLSLFNICLEGYTHKAKLLGCGLAMLFSNDDDDDEEGYFKENANYFKEQTNLKRKSISKGWAVSPSEVKTNMYNLNSEIYAFGIFILELLYGISKEVAFEKERNLKEDMEKQVEKIKRNRNRLEIIMRLNTKESFFNFDTRAGGSLSWLIARKESTGAYRMKNKDKTINNWPISVASALLQVADYCIMDKDPSMRGVLKKLRKIVHLKVFEDREVMKEKNILKEISVVREKLKAKALELKTLQEEQLQEEEEEKRQAEKEKKRIEEEQKKAKKQERLCPICYCDYDVSEGLECKGKNHHFVCNGCLNHHVMYFVDAESLKRYAKHGGVRCVAAGELKCEAPVYADTDLARHLSDATFSLVLAAKNQVAEQKINAELEKDFEKRLQAEKDKLAKLGAEAVMIRELRNFVVNEIITCKCPRCGQVFIDFAGCWALYCGRAGCGCGFCGWCGADSGGGDAHGHVGKCKRYAAKNATDKWFGGAKDKRGGASGAKSGNEFRDAQNVRRKAQLIEFLRMLPKENADILVQGLEKDLKGVAMNPNDFRNKQGSKYYSKQNDIDCMKVVKKLKNKKGWKWK